ncbi:tyrosine-type recombinase/integrase [Streptomyces sp. CA-210063]|uniref:tyrosine-type recombinase/integrase n=1 Tax=Streptomyces sp. CA-210063 TaxID=2801029 RepID=UPI0027D473BC|nr:tyrosine-type recombinase/integrase [Streptomyces sp. CA-210063]
MPWCSPPSPRAVPDGSSPTATGVGRPGGPPSKPLTYFDTDGEQQLVPHYPPHSMRHTCASWLVQKGVSLYEVQHLLGHESFQTTQRYAHLQLDAHKAVLGAWERLDVPLTIAA